jgi:undecaprenyl-diphosphatase
VLDHVFVFLSRVGSYGAVWMAIAVLCAWRYRMRYLPLLVIAMTLLCEITNYGLKTLIDRERPPSHEAGNPPTLMSTPDTPSLPSGHAATAFLGATLIAFSVPRLAPFLYALAALVAWSRVYVGVHYPLDLVAGALYGIALAFGFRVLQRLVASLMRLRRAPTAG